MPCNHNDSYWCVDSRYTSTVPTVRSRFILEGLSVYEDTPSQCLPLKSISKQCCESIFIDISTVIMSSTFEFNHRKERGWNDQVLAPGPPLLRWRRAPSPDRDLQNLIINGKLPSVQSAKSLPTKTTIDSQQPSAFDSIAATLGFQHHHGTDKSAELKVLKKIMKRETLLSVLVEACNPKKTNTIVLQNKKGTGVLDLMTRLRETTVDLIEIICYWRTTMIGNDPEYPRPFLYEHQNYLLKVVNDMDFLAEITPLVECLGINGDRMLRNPLMMPESLDIEKLDILPAEWALKDTNHDNKGPLYQDRLRLRKVEHILLQEIEFNQRGNPSVSAWESTATTTTIESPPTRPNATKRDLSIERKLSMLEWYDEARCQMFKLEEAQSEHLDPTLISTHRMDIPAPDPNGMDSVKYAYSPPRMAEPVKLLELTSDKVSEPYGESSPTSCTARPSTSSKARRLKRLPSADSSSTDYPNMESLCPEVVMQDTDIVCMLAIEHAPRSVALAGAAVLIVLAEGQRVPEDISWEAFREVACSTPMAKQMNAIVPQAVPQVCVVRISRICYHVDCLSLIVGLSGYGVV